MKTMTLKLPDHLHAEIASEARARNLSKSEVLRERLSRPANGASRTTASLWRRMEDLVIKTDSLPVDLSSNKAHLKGYGKNRSHR